MNDQDNGLQEMDLLGHLTELRARLIRCIAYLILGFILTYIYKDSILDIVLIPILKINPDIREYLVFLAPAEGFLTFIRLAVYSSLLIVVPAILYELWLFIKPGLYKREQRASSFFFVISLGLFYLGLGLAYVLVVPYGFNFLMGFGSGTMVPMISIKEFVIFVFRVLIMFGIIFQTPLILFLMSLFGIVNSKILSKYRRYIIIVIFIISAAITPPDPVTQVLLALPLVLLYEISIIVIKIREKGRLKA